jgi:2-polyprenyl-3-methyl-5-hydroxy-6-metoxy-1,4-benzoquinol methylase
MGECCGQAGYQAVFGERFARWIARKYCKHGLDPTQRLMVSFLTDRGIKDASVLEIGGGVGEFQIELLSRGAREATNLEISRGYESQAAALLDRAGMTDRVTRRLVDIATSPEEVEPADVVVLHRVVCCYPDYERLLSAAASHAKRLLVYSHPRRNLLTRAFVRFANLLLRVPGKDFRLFAHPPAVMAAAAQAEGLSVSYRHRGPVWQIVGLERLTPVL